MNQRIAPVVAAAVLILVLADLAFAHCSWVLWPQNAIGVFIQGLLVYDTRQECELAQKDFVKNWDPKDQEEWRKIGAGRAHPSHWRCLPDTIDPRESKR